MPVEMIDLLLIWEGLIGFDFFSYIKLIESMFSGKADLPEMTQTPAYLLHRTLR